ncbi:DUF3667 domain-containing protein [Solilutibacter silvestris]|uniref:DUF3667 domain-containing protein n=1 Tax=Solilutibacter silvestris TaxID=1645665 RepID=UPI003D32C115
MHDTNACANCLRAIDATDQRFCPGCGQPTPAHRIDWHFISHELEHSVLHMDRGILFTLRQLVLRPGDLIRDYIEGRRANLVKPLLLLMILSAAIVFLSSMQGVGTMAVQFDGASVSQDKIFRLVDDWMTAHFALVTILLLPLEALAFKLVFRGAQGLNYPEWLVIIAFLTAQTMMLWILALLLQRWMPHLPQWAVLLSMVYGVFSLVQFFRDEPRWKTVLRSLGSYLVFIVMNQVLVWAAFFVVFALTRHH